MSDSFIIATAEQVEQLKVELDELLARYRRIGQGNPNARRLAVYSALYPLDLDRVPRAEAPAGNAPTTARRASTRAARKQDR
jgi:hypothetical protein